MRLWNRWGSSAGHHSLLFPNTCTACGAKPIFKEMQESCQELRDVQSLLEQHLKAKESSPLCSIICISGQKYSFFLLSSSAEAHHEGVFGACTMAWTTQDSSTGVAEFRVCGVCDHKTKSLLNVLEPQAWLTACRYTAITSVHLQRSKPLFRAHLKRHQQDHTGNQCKGRANLTVKMHIFFICSVQTSTVWFNSNKVAERNSSRGWWF